MKWFLLLPVNLVVNIVAALGAPVWALFASDAGTYPGWLQWAATWDYLADGDPPFIEQHAPFKGKQTGWRRYVNRVVWMFRNPAYGFDRTISIVPTSLITVKGTRPLSGDLKFDGWFFAWCDEGWQLYITHHWNATHCTKINLGWKLWLAPERCTFVCSPTGFWKLIS